MPGIVGLLTTMPRARAEAELLRMVQALRHEPFYRTGTWIDESLGIYVGWVVRRNSFSDGMPLWSEACDVGLVFSGEEFPAPGTIRDLAERRPKVARDGPSYLVHLAEEDSSFPAGLNGAFHGLLIDRRRGTAKLFNDRYGMHRICYHESKQGFYFAAEAKAILAVRPEVRTADPRGLGEFVACGCVLENRTLFAGLHVLPPSAAWLFRNGTLERKHSYFRARDWEDQEALEPEAYYRELRTVFSRNLSRYFEGRERIGMSLTGGLDTRMIMAWQEPAPGSLPCYTFGGMFRDCRDVIVAGQVARACRQPHEVIRVGQEFLSAFPTYAERSVYLTDGCIDVGRAPDLYINEKARQIAPVRMTGNMGDEVLRQARTFKPVEPARGLFRPQFLPYVRQAADTYDEITRGHPLSFAAFQQAPWNHTGILALEQTQLAVRSPYLDNDFVRTVFRAPQSALANNDVRLRLIRDGNHTLARLRTDRGFGGQPGVARLAARAFHELTFRAEYSCDYGLPGKAAPADRLVSALRLRRLFVGRHKFYHFALWYRGSLAAYVRDMLLDARTLSRPYLERSGVESIVRGHVSGDRNYTAEIHKVLTLELLHRQFLDRN